MIINQLVNDECKVIKKNRLFKVKSNIFIQNTSFIHESGR